MILNQQLFDVKIIDETTGDLILYLPPQRITGIKMKNVINGIGNLVLTMPYADDIWNSFGLDHLIEVSTINYNTNLLEKEATFLLRKRELYFEEEIKQISFSCVGLMDLVRRRTVKPTSTDDTNAGGYVTRSGTAGDVLGEFVDEQMINPDDVNRAYANLTYNKVTSGNIVGIRTRYENLLNIFDTIRINGDVEYDMIRVSDNDLQIQVGKLGTDRTYSTNYPSTPFLLFSPVMGNTINPLFSDDYQEMRNYIYVLGEGEGVNQNVLELSDITTGDSIYNRIESTVESRKGESSTTSAAQQSLTIGLKEINANKSNRKFEFELIENRMGYRYNTDFSLGDLVTFFWEGVQFDFEIKGTVLTVNGSNISRTIEFEIEGD